MFKLNCKIYGFKFISYIKLRFIIFHHQFTIIGYHRLAWEFGRSSSMRLKFFMAVLIYRLTSDILLEPAENTCRQFKGFL